MPGSTAGCRYEYLVENLTASSSSVEIEHEAVADRVKKLSLAASTTVSRPMPELDFAGPKRTCARVHYFIEIDSAARFDADSLYVAYYALAAPGWRLMPHCVASSVTQTSWALT